MKDPFKPDRWYCFDETVGTNVFCYSVYENGQFITNGLTLRQAQDFCHGASLIEIGIQQLSF